MKFSIKDFFSQWDQICRKLRIWSHILKKSSMENFIFCAVISYAMHVEDRPAQNGRSNQASDQGIFQKW